MLDRHIVIALLTTTAQAFAIASPAQARQIAERSLPARTRPASRTAGHDRH